MIALLLILQAAGLVGINLYNIKVNLARHPEIEKELSALETEADYFDFSPEAQEVVEAFIAAILLILPAIPALIAAIGFLFLLRFGWLLAMLTQTVLLLICLMLYLEWQPVIIYPIMLYCVLMVLYLNLQDVRLAFAVRSERDE